MAVLYTFPKETIAGDTLRVTRAYSDYPAPTWTATLYAENKDSTFSSEAAADGSDHAFTVSAATSAAIKAGRYRWFVRVTDGSIVETVEDGWLEVLINPAASGNADRRSWARRTLDALEAVLEGKATADQAAMSINGRSISRIPLSELNQWHDKLRQQVRTEEAGAGAGLGRNIYVRLGRG